VPRLAISEENNSFSPEHADNNAGVLATSGGRLNPYKLGVELYRNIEERWNKGQFGKEWEDCDDQDAKRHWNLRLDLGKQKIFEVRALYNDVTFIDEFLTPDFCRDHKLFSFSWSNRNERYEIETREFKQVKEKLLTEMGIDPVVAEHKEWNGKVEVFNANLHKELFDAHRFYDVAEMRRRLETHLHWYNHARTHHALGGLLVPADRYDGRAAEVLARIEAGAGRDLGDGIELRERCLELFKVTSRGGVPEVWPRRSREVRGVRARRDSAAQRA